MITIHNANGCISMDLIPFFDGCYLQRPRGGERLREGLSRSVYVAPIGPYRNPGKLIITTMGLRLFPVSD